MTFITAARGRACFNGDATPRPNTRVCGDETTDGYVKDYCDTQGSTDVTVCGIAYAAANNTAVTAVSVAEFAGTGENKPLNSDGSGLATVIDAGGANADDDADANFITGGAGALVTGLTQTNDAAFRLSVLGTANPADAISGFAVAIAEQKYYVGLLSGTNMGRLLPNADAETTLEWSAKLRILRGTTFATAQNFTLLVELSGKTISVKTGSIIGDVFAINDGKFTANGLLYGGITFGNDSATAGTLTGLIGADGAVGIFKSDNVNNRYVGGFVAAPLQPVNYADWVRGHNPDATADLANPRHQILQSKDGTLDTTGLTLCPDSSSASHCGAVGSRTAPLVHNRNLQSGFFDGRRINGDINDGYAIFEGYIGETRYDYYGIFDSTDLGATLPVWETGQPASAEWKGQFSVRQGANAVANEDLTLEVNFQNRRLTAFVPVGTNHYLLDAGFNADDDGFFAGTVNFGEFTDKTNRTSTNTLTSGVLTGIIGVDGAIGAFVSGTTADNGRTITGGAGENGFAGGFVACPYNEGTNRCQ